MAVWAIGGSLLALCGVRMTGLPGHLGHVDHPVPALVTAVVGAAVGAGIVALALRRPWVSNGRTRRCAGAAPGSPSGGDGDPRPDVQHAPTRPRVAAGTVARAYRELEPAGTIAIARGRGTVVMGPAATAVEQDPEPARAAADFARAAAALGADADTAVAAGTGGLARLARVLADPQSSGSTAIAQPASARTTRDGDGRPSCSAIHPLVATSASRSTPCSTPSPSSIQTRSSVARLPVADSA